jgi:DNA-binding SARP family transcriptional activator/pimeloyl-ACP methyl ester carboxylesterase
VLVRVLGAVELVASGGTIVPLPGTRQPALLAALAARAGEVVSTDRLITLLWGDDLPENPEASLHSAVFKLRNSLRSACGRDVLLTRERGYQLALSPGDLDAAVFDDLLAQADDRPPAEAAATLGNALRLWRGPAYGGGFADTEIAHLEAMRLEESRWTAVERRAEALLACGRAAEVVPFLEPFVAEHPLRESARATLMRALHQAGRTPEALEHYQSHRTHLSEELGLEPSRLMRAIQAELLREPSGAAAPPTSRQETVVPSRPRGLPGLQVRYLRTSAGNVVAHGTTGKGPPLVVILGWISSLDVIASGRDPRSSLLERLTGDDVSLTLYDRAGTGLSPGPVADYGLEASVEELADVVRTVGPPVSLLAMSAAGPIAISLAARRPDWVSSLVLFGTFADGPNTFPDKTLRDMIVQITRTHWRLGSKILADLYRPGVSDGAAWHLSDVFRESAEADVAADYLESMYDHDVMDLLPSVQAPSLILHYRGDRLISFRGAKDFATGLPNATLVPLDGRVHLPDAHDLDHIEKAIVDHIHRHG